MSASHSLSPVLPSVDAPGLADLALEFEREAAALGSLLHPDVASTVADLLRLVNTYYSNRIEGHDTTPAAIDAAMREEYAADPAVREVQRLATAHVVVEIEAERRLIDSPEMHPLSADALCALHRGFYERVDPGHRWVANRAASVREAVIPGAFRTFDVRVGAHVAPGAETIPALMAFLSDAYAPEHITGLNKVLAFAASHHRLLWVHPFADGNGRVIRLATTLYGRRLGIGAMGLWSPSRGLARRRTAYMGALAEADLTRRNDLDGRGGRSLEGLTKFVRFFLETCLDQVRYMRSVLALDGLARRLDDYTERRARGVLTGPAGTISAAAAPVLRECLVSGAIPRGRVATVGNISPRWATALISDLLADGLLRTDSPRGPVRLGMPVHALRHLLPDLYPEGVDDAWSAPRPAG